MADITEYIPQRAPILMVDEFLGFDGGISKSRLQVLESNIFVDGGVFSECGLIEHIAQSAAARVGYIFRSKDEPVPLGFIGAVNNFVLNENPKVGDVIHTEIEVVQELMNLSLIEARCSVDGRPAAQCRMKIFLDL